MANVKISGLPTASTPLTGAELVPVVQSGVTSQTTVDAFNYFKQEGTFAVATTVQAKLRETVSVFDFMTAAEIAAVQTNTWTTVTDVTSAIQNALNTHIGKIYFPVGTYVVASTIIIKPERILIGEGGGAYFQGSGYNRISVIKPTSTFSGTEVFRADPADVSTGLSYTYGIAIRDMLIDMINIKNSGKTAIKLMSLSNSETFDSVRIINNNNNKAIHIGKSSNASALQSDGLLFSNVYTLSCDSGTSYTTPVLLLDSANEISFRDCKFQGSANASTATNSMAAQISAASGSAVNAVTFDSCSFTGAEVGLRIQGNSTDGQGPRWIRVQNCTFEGPKYGVYVSGTSAHNAQFNVVGSGNRFISLASGGYGVLLDAYATNNTLMVDEFTTVSLNTNSSSNTVYGGNAITNTGTNNVQVLNNSGGFKANNYYIESWNKPNCTTGSITSGTNALYVVDGSGIVNGMSITVTGAGVAGANLTATVGSGGGTTTIILSANASTTVSGAVVDVPLGSNWVSNTASRNTAGYRKDQFNRVYLRGYLTGGTYGYPNYILTLPSGYRPVNGCDFAAACGSGTGSCDLTILSTGEVFATGGSGFLSLDGISFSTT